MFFVYYFHQYFLLFYFYMVSTTSKKHIIYNRNSYYRSFSYKFHTKLFVTKLCNIYKVPNQRKGKLCSNRKANPCTSHSLGFGQTLIRNPDSLDIVMQTFAQILLRQLICSFHSSFFRTFLIFLLMFRFTFKADFALLY